MHLCSARASVSLGTEYCLPSEDARKRERARRGRRAECTHVRQRRGSTFRVRVLAHCPAPVRSVLLARLLAWRRPAERIVAAPGSTRRTSPAGQGLRSCRLMKPSEHARCARTGPATRATTGSRRNRGWRRRRLPVDPRSPRLLTAATLCDPPTDPEGSYRAIDKMAGSRYAYVRNFELPDPLLPSTFFVIRIDGKGFHGFSKLHHFEKPNDKNALSLMNEAAKRVVGGRELNGECVLAFGESDEYRSVHLPCPLDPSLRTDLVDRARDLLTQLCIQANLQAAWTKSQVRLFPRARKRVALCRLGGAHCSHVSPGQQTRDSRRVNIQCRLRGFVAAVLPELSPHPGRAARV